MPTGKEYETQIQKQFPNLANLYKNIPEAWNILVWAVASGMAPEQVQAAIQNTKYYRSKTDKQKAWDALAATNPAEARRLQEQAQRNTLLASVRIGANLNKQQLAYISQGAVENGWSEQELLDTITGYTLALPEAKRTPGAFTAAMTKVRAVADEYGMPVDSNEAASWASRLLYEGSAGSPGADEASLRDVFKTRAQSLYPSLRAQLDAGVTVAQWASPYKQVAAQELGVSADSITFNDPKWKSMLAGSSRTEGGKTVLEPMTLDEWQTKIRTDQQYGFDRTSNGKAAAAGIAGQILGMFGHEA